MAQWWHRIVIQYTLIIQSVIHYNPRGQWSFDRPLLLLLLLTKSLLLLFIEVTIHSVLMTGDVDIIPIVDWYYIRWWSHCYCRWYCYWCVGIGIHWRYWLMVMQYSIGDPDGDLLLRLLDEALSVMSDPIVVRRPQWCSHSPIFRWRCHSLLLTVIRCCVIPVLFIVVILHCWYSIQSHSLLLTELLFRPFIPDDIHWPVLPVLILILLLLSVVTSIVDDGSIDIRSHSIGVGNRSIDWWPIDLSVF